MGRAVSTNKAARRIEADSRTQQFVSLFCSYGETIVSHISKNLGQQIDPAFLDKVNQTIEPLLRRQIEELVKDYQRVTYEALTGDSIGADEVAYRTQFPRRRRYHLRVLTLAVADLISFDLDGVGDQPAPGQTKRLIRTAQFPKILIEGLDQWTRSALEGPEIEAVNMAAFRALDRLDILTDGESEESDRDMWRLLHELDDAMALVCPVLMPFLKRFAADFEEARTLMQRAIGQGTKSMVQLNAKSWDLLFSRIFGRLLRYIGASERQDLVAKVDAEERAIIATVTENYRQWRSHNQLK